MMAEAPHVGPEFYVGQEFDDFQSLEARVKEYADSCGVRFYKNDSKSNSTHRKYTSNNLKRLVTAINDASLSASIQVESEGQAHLTLGEHDYAETEGQTNTNIALQTIKINPNLLCQELNSPDPTAEPIDERYKYRYVKFCCECYGDPRPPRLKGNVRQRRQKVTKKMGCEAQISARFDRQRLKYLISNACLQHNHELVPYEQVLQTTREFSSEVLEETQKLIALGVKANKLLVHLQTITGEKDILQEEVDQLVARYRKTVQKPKRTPKRIHTIVVKQENTEQEHVVQVRAVKRMRMPSPVLPKVETETLGKVFVIKINRPAVRNCVDRETAELLRQTFVQFERNPDLHVAVLHGNGGHFCSGLDLKELASFTSKEELQNDDSVRPMGPTKMAFSKPVIAAVAGYAVAGGMELSLLCDMRVCEENTIFGIFCRRFGVPLIDGGTIRLPQLIGLSRAMDLILTGRPVNAREAMDFGIANRVVPTGTGLGEAVKLATTISNFPQECMKSDRKSAYHAAYDGQYMDEAFDYEWNNAKATVTTEAIAGAKRFALGQGKHGKFD